LNEKAQCKTTHINPWSSGIQRMLSSRIVRRRFFTGRSANINAQKTALHQRENNSHNNGNYQHSNNDT